MLGLKVMTKRGLDRLRGEIAREEFNRALAEIVGLLRGKENIYLEPVKMGPHATVKNSVFFSLHSSAPALLILGEATSLSNTTDELLL